MDLGKRPLQNQEYASKPLRREPPGDPYRSRKGVRGSKCAFLLASLPPLPMGRCVARENQNMYLHEGPSFLGLRVNLTQIRKVYVVYVQFKEYASLPFSPPQISILNSVQMNANHPLTLLGNFATNFIHGSST